MTDTSAWYAKGLRFACTQCGSCCGGEPGNVYVSDSEIAALADRLGLDEAAFRRRYTRTIHRRRQSAVISLIEKPNNDCVFYDRQSGCTVYQDRPQQCRTWPFWRSNLQSSEDWAEAAADCPGIGRGEVVPASTINEIAAQDGLP